MLEGGILTIVGSVATGTACIVLYLEARFRRVESIVYREMQIHRREDDAQFGKIGTRLQRVELKAFGFTHSGE